MPPKKSQRRKKIEVMADDFMQAMRPKYNAKSGKIFPQVVGCKSQMIAYSDWLQKWTPGIGFAFFRGKSGCGKGVVAQVVAEARGWRVQEVDLSDIPAKKRANARGSTSHLVCQDGIVFVCRGLDCVLCDSGLLGRVRDHLRTLCANNPTVVISSAEGLAVGKPITGLSSKIFEFGSAMPSEIAKFLEPLGGSAEMRKSIASCCRGDIRNALISMHFAMLCNGGTLVLTKDQAEPSTEEKMRKALRGIGDLTVLEGDERAPALLRDAAWESVERVGVVDMSRVIDFWSECDVAGFSHDVCNPEFQSLETIVPIRIVGQKISSEFVPPQFKNQTSRDRGKKPLFKKTKDEATERLNSTIT